MPRGNQGLVLGYCVIIDEEEEEEVYDDHDDEVSPNIQYYKHILNFGILEIEQSLETRQS
jgi:hypothetical protein